MLQVPPSLDSNPPLPTHSSPPPSPTAFSAGGNYGNASQPQLAARVHMCHFESQLAIQDDGSFVEGGGTPSTMFTRNWGTNSGKAGLRWDGYYPGTRGGVMAENVIWNASALVIKV